MSDPRPIGVFDSGVGGLTVARSIMNVLPRESIAYFGDTARYPYGPRSLDEHAGARRETANQAVDDVNRCGTLDVDSIASTSADDDEVSQEHRVGWSGADGDSVARRRRDRGMETWSAAHRDRLSGGE